MRRIRFDWPVVLAAWALLVAAATLLTAGTLYADAVALGGLRAAVGAAPAADRSVRVSLSSAASQVAGLDAIVRPELQRLVDSGGGGSAALFLSSGSMAPAAEASSGTTLTILASRPGIERHATLVTGRWPVAGATPREAVLSAPAAKGLGATAGGRLSLVDRINPGKAIDIAVVGIFDPTAGDPYWLDDALDLQGRSVQASFTTFGPVVLDQADLLAIVPSGRVNVEWRAIPAVEDLAADGLTPLAAAATALPDRLHAALPAAFLPRIATDLPAIVARVDRSVLVGRSGILVLVLEFAVVAAYAIVLVAGMLADRRRSETALLRTRGASGGHVGGIALAEAVLLAGTAAMVAPWLSLAVVGAIGTSGALTAARGNLSLSPAALSADGIAMIAGVVAMTLPSLGGIPSLAGVRAAISRQAGRTLGQRLGLDLALVVLAAIALWQLRLYGAPLTQNARGVLGIDPLLVAAPGIGLLAGALLATRLLPRAAEIAEPLLARGRGLVGAIGGRGVARRPLRYTRSALLLMLAAALATFATAHVATWTQSQADQAAYQVGADVRIVPSTGPASGIDAASVSGLPAASEAMAVDRLDVDSGRSVRGGAALAIDAANAGSIVDQLPVAERTGVSERLAALVAARPSVAGLAIPDGARQLSVVLDPELAVGEGSGFTDADLVTDPGFSLAFVVQDGTGRLQRYGSGTGFLAGHHQRLVAPLDDGGIVPAGLAATHRTLRAIEMTIAPSHFFDVTGAVDFGPLEWAATPVSAAPSQGPTESPVPSGAPSDAGTAWQAIAPLTDADPTWSGTTADGGQLRMSPYHPTAAHPSGVVLSGRPGDLSPAFGGGQPVDVRIAWLGSLAGSSIIDLPVIASQRFLDLTAGHIGDRLPAAIRGSRIEITIVGAAEVFPTLDPATPFVVFDGPSLVLARYAASGNTDPPNEWWLASSDPRATAAAASALDPNATVLSRAVVEAGLLGDPLALGVVGLLGLGSLAAMVFAAIGFIVNATVSTAEREGELALLRALGLSGGQLSAWLSAEHGLLLVAGLGGGVALGVLLAWLVLPFSTLTTTGDPAVPAPVVVVPPDGLLPVVALAALIFLVTIVVLRRQLLRLRIGSALRARDE